MRLFILLSLFFSLNLTAQRQFFVEYTSSLRGPEYSNDLILDNSLSLYLKKNKSLYSLGFGREDWYMEFFENYTYNPEYFTFHCRTYKLTVLIERQFLIPKTKLSVRLGAGGKIYFLNQMKDSYILNNDRNFLVGTKPSSLAKVEEITKPYNVIGLKYYSYIKSVPFAFTGNLAIQYNFNHCALKLYFEPYLMFLQCKNAKDFNKETTFIFYSNLGLGINYPLNFKKKASTVTPLQLIPNF